MNYPEMAEQNPYAVGVAVDAPSTERAVFLKNTYLHLLGAVAVFAALEYAFFQVLNVEAIFESMTGGYAWLAVLGVFLLVSFVAERMARSATSMAMQYAGLGLYLLIEAVIFIPLIYVASRIDSSGKLITASALATGILFTGLSAVVYITRKDFSFLRSALYFMGFVALGLIVCSIVFGFSLGIIFTVAMIAFACLWILYDTSNVLHHYRTDQHVVASLALFASLALLFWYVLRLGIYLYSMADD